MQRLLCGDPDRGYSVGPPLIYYVRPVPKPGILSFARTALDPLCGRWEPVAPPRCESSPMEGWRAPVALVTDLGVLRQSKVQGFS